MKDYPADNLAYRYPVSVKGIVLIENKIPLLKNERDEFELPGGKLEIHEQPIDCVIREIKEELNINVKPIDIVDSWLYTIKKNVRVVIITYGCILLKKNQPLKLSKEHKEILFATSDNISLINMPEGYKNSIRKWLIKNSHDQQ